MGDFLHFWRVNGWYLGVKDENNAALEANNFSIFFLILDIILCMQNVEETREMAKLVLERILKPCMS